MKKIIRAVFIAVLVVAAPLAALSHANAQVALNGQEGDNKDRTEQTGTSKSGDANTGQVVGAVSGGKTSVDATNKTDKADVSTGDASAINDSSSFAGQNLGGLTFVDNLGDTNATDVFSTFSVNLQEGNNKVETVQMATAMSGDGVGGEVIGVVTSAGGSASVVAANTSKNVDVTTGDARARNISSAFAGQDVSFFTGVGAFITDVTAIGGAINLQEGDNTVRSWQTATAATGDGVAGQVLGIVSAGDASVDATNASEQVDIASGDSHATNANAAFAGQNVSFGIGVIAADIFVTPFAFNVQEGNNRANASQNTDATSGDVVGGQIGGIVTSAGGSADVVLANTSTWVDTASGDSRDFNTNAAFVGQNLSLFIDV